MATVTLEPGKVRTLSWQNDPMIRARMSVVHKCWMEGKNVTQTAEVLHDWAIDNHIAGKPPTRSTVSTDRKHIMELQDDVDEDMRLQHLMALDNVISTAYEGYKSAIAGTPMAGPGYLNVVRQAIETKAKVGGTMVQRIEQKVVASEPDQARIMIGILVKHFDGDEAKALMALDEMQNAIDVKSKVLTIEAPSHAKQ